MTKLSVILFLVAYLLTQSNTQTTYRNIARTTVRPGSYVPNPRGDNSGRYIPDDRGRYKHVSIPPLPYEHISIPPLPPGGYQGGDRGVPYQNKYFPTSPLPRTTTRFPIRTTTRVPIRTTTRVPIRTTTRTTARTTTKASTIYEQNKSFNLGPRDHLRFMLDFNFNDGGWQIVQFDWNHDDENGFSKPKYNYVNERKLFDLPPRKLQSHLDGYFYGTGPNDLVHLDAQLDKDIASYNFTETNPRVQIADNANIRETIGEVLDYVKRYVLPKLV